MKPWRSLPTAETLTDLQTLRTLYTQKPDTMTTKQQRTARFYDTLTRLGFTYEETETLRRAEMTLHRWAERECNGEVEIDDDGKAYSAFGSLRARYRVPNREAGARHRVANTLAARNARHDVGDALSAYFQTDPRGCALYVIRPDDVPAGEDVEAYYSRGVAVCI